MLPFGAERRTLLRSRAPDCLWILKWPELLIACALYWWVKWIAEVEGVTGSMQSATPTDWWYCGGKCLRLFIRLLGFDWLEAYTHDGSSLIRSSSKWGKFIELRGGFKRDFVKFLYFNNYFNLSNSYAHLPFWGRWRGVWQLIPSNFIHICCILRTCNNARLFDSEMYLLMNEMQKGRRGGSRIGSVGSLWEWKDDDVRWLVVWIMASINGRGLAGLSDKRFSVSRFSILVFECWKRVF